MPSLEVFTPHSRVFGRLSVLKQQDSLYHEHVQPSAIFQQQQALVPLPTVLQKLEMSRTKAFKAFSSHGMQRMHTFNACACGAVTAVQSNIS